MESPKRHFVNRSRTEHYFLRSSYRPKSDLDFNLNCAFVDTSRAFCLLTGSSQMSHNALFLTRLARNATFLKIWGIVFFFFRVSFRPIRPLRLIFQKKQCPLFLQPAIYIYIIIYIHTPPAYDILYVMFYNISDNIQSVINILVFYIVFNIGTPHSYRPRPGLF